MATTRELLHEGWRTPERMREATWQQRVDALGRGGYRRYDESTSTKLEENAAWLIEEHHGDLRELRRDDGDVDALRHALDRDDPGCRVLLGEPYLGGADVRAGVHDHRRFASLTYLVAGRPHDRGMMREFAEIVFARAQCVPEGHQVAVGRPEEQLAELCARAGEARLYNLPREKIARAQRLNVQPLQSVFLDELHEFGISTRNWTRIDAIRVS